MAEDVLARARAASAAGDQNTALTLFIEALDNDLTRVHIVREIAFTFSALNRHDEAIRAYQIWLSHDQTDIAAWCNAGISFIQLGQPAEAIQAFDRALALDPGDANAHRFRTIALILQYNWEQVQIGIENMSAELGARNEDFYALRDVIVQLQPPSMVEQALRTVLNAYPTLFVAFAQLVGFLIGQNRLDEAADVYEGMLRGKFRPWISEIDSASADLARIYLSMNRTDRAIDVLQRAVRRLREPKRAPKSYQMLRQVYLAAGRGDLGSDVASVVTIEPV